MTPSFPTRRFSVLNADLLHPGEVVGSARVGLVEDLLFGRATTEQRDELVEQLLARLQVCVLALGVGDEAEGRAAGDDAEDLRSEEHTSELQSLMRISNAVSCLKKKTKNKHD